MLLKIISIPLGEIILLLSPFLVIFLISQRGSSELKPVMAHKWDNHTKIHNKTPSTHQITDDYPLKLRRKSLFNVSFLLQQQPRLLRDIGILMDLVYSGITPAVLMHHMMEILPMKCSGPNLKVTYSFNCSL